MKINVRNFLTSTTLYFIPFFGVMTVLLLGFALSFMLSYERVSKELAKAKLEAGYTTQQLVACQEKVEFLDHMLKDR